MRALVLAILLAAGCSKNDPPKETAHVDGGKSMVRAARSAAAASATAPPDAGR